MSTMEVSVNGLQYIQLTAAMLRRVAAVLDSIPDDITVTAPWTINWDEWTGWLSVFNFDFELLSEYADNLRWTMPAVVDEAVRTVGVTLVFGLTTVLLIQSLPAIVWLSMMTASILAIVFAVAAKSMLTTARLSRRRTPRNYGAIPAQFRRNSSAILTWPIPTSGTASTSATSSTRAPSAHHLRRHLRRPYVRAAGVRRLLEREVDRSRRSWRSTPTGWATAKATCRTTPRRRHAQRH